MASQLAIYNDALAFLGESRPLASLSESRADRRALDAAWDVTVQYVLEEGQWSFSIRSIEISPDTDIGPLFGFQYAYTLPSDYVRIAKISSTETFFEPLTKYEIEAGKIIFANVNPLYLSYVSNGSTYGNDMEMWPQVFCKALSAYLAFMTCMQITQGRAERNDLFSLYQRYISDARSKDALNKPSQSLPRGSFRRARSGWQSWVDRR